MITNTPTTTIVFVNAQVANYQNLLKQVQPDTEFLLINADQDGIEQITNTLKNRQNITSVQIISHGGEGEIQLGTTRLNRDSIQAYREQLEQWRKALTAEADILLFGCSVGFGQGQEFLRDLSIFTGADVAASVDITGNALLGGDWDLEFATGNIEAGIAISSEGQQAYAGILPLIVEYFIGNNTKEGNGVERTEVKQWSTRSTISNSAGLIREDWGTGSPPNSNVNQDNFIVRWTGYVYASSTGDYKFYENSDDGVRLWVNNRRLIEEWNKSGLDKENSASIYLEGGKWYAIQMDYFDWDASAAVNLQWQPPGSSKAYIPNNYLIPLASSTATGPNDLGYGLKGEYFNNRDLSGNPVYTQVDSAINFDWGDGSPNNKVNSNNFSVRWTGSIVIPETGSYVFSAETDDGVRLRINNSSNYDIDRWSDGSRSQDGGYIRTFSKGNVVPITLEYFENSGGAKAKLLWQAWTNDNKTNEIISKSFIPTTSLIPYTDRPNIYISFFTGASEQDGKAQFKIGTSSTIPAGGINVFYRLLPLNGASTDDFSDPNLGQLTLTPTEKEKVITINIADDDIAESNENLRIEIIPGVQYQSGYSLDVPIIDNEPIISVIGYENPEEAGKTGKLKLKFDRPLTQTLTLKFEVSNSGNDTESDDYLLRTVTVSNNQLDSKQEVTVDLVEAKDDDITDLPRNGEKFTVRLVPNSGNLNNYHVNASQNSATFTIVDDEPTIGIEKLTDGSEDRGKNAEFKLVFDRQRGKEFTLKLNLEAVTNKDASDPNKYVKTTGTNTIRGNHINTTKGADYLFYWRYADHSKKEYFTGNEITVQANTGQSNKTIIIGVEPIDDDVAENTESVTVGLVQQTTNTGTERNQFYQVDTQKQSATVTIADNEPTLELVTVRNAKEYGALLPDQEDSYSIGYIELKSDKPILNSLGLWVKYTITAGENVIQGVDYLNSQYRKVSFKPDTQQNGIIIPQIEELKIPGNTVVDQNKIRIYFMALPDAIKENAENLRIDIQPYYFDLDVTNNKDISNFRLKQNGQIVNNITADITIEDSGLYQSQVFIVDRNDQLVNTNNPLVIRDGKSVFKVKLGSQPTKDVTVQFNQPTSGNLDYNQIQFQYQASKGSSLISGSRSLTEGSTGTIEPNDTSEKAIAITTTAFTFDGEISSDYSKTDVDLFKIALRKGDTISIRVDARSTNPIISNLDSRLKLFNSQGVIVTEKDDDPGRSTDPSIEYTITSDDTYYIGVAYYSVDYGLTRINNSSQNSGKYKLSVNVIPNSNAPDPNSPIVNPWDQWQTITLNGVNSDFNLTASVSSTDGNYTKLNISVPVTTQIPLQNKVTEGAQLQDLGTPRLSLLADSSITENSDKPGQFRLQLSHAAKEDLTVSYTVSGTATLGSDYTGNLSTVNTRPANGQISASSSSLVSPVGEEKEKAFDNNTNTKWLISAKSAWIQYQLPNNNAAIFNSYIITSANDLPSRDPQSWELLGSTDGITFEKIDQQSGIKFTNRFETKTFAINNTKAYQYYRLNITSNNGANELQLAEFNLYHRIIIPKGETVAILPVFPVRDSIKEQKENLTISLNPGNGYTIDSNNQSKALQIIDSNIAGLEIANVSFNLQNLNAQGQPTPIIASSFRPLQTSENGDGESFAIRLQSKPSSDVTVSFTGLNTTEGELKLYQGGTISPIVFTPDNWDQYQIITVVGKADTLVDSNITYQIQATPSSADSNYNNTNLQQNITVTNQNIDSNTAINSSDITSPDPTLPVAKFSGNNATIAEEGSSQKVQITLDRSAPQGGLTVSFSVDGSTATLNQDFIVNTNIFQSQPGAANPFDQIDIGNFSTPSFADLDKDGDLDLALGNADGTVKFYENIGSPGLPSFIEQTGTKNPFKSIDIGNNSTPTFVDIDKDGDLDIIIGNSAGTISYYENITDSTGIKFGLRTSTNNPFNGIDVGDNSTPTFADLDKDGDLDAVIGTADGTIKYYKNTGIPSKPTFTAQTGTSNPFNNIDIGDNSTPNIIDADNDGDFDLFIGRKDGTISFYRNTGNASTPIFTLDSANSPSNTWKVQANSAPVFADVNNDGDLDAVIGAADGKLQYQEQLQAVVIPEGQTTAEITINSIGDQIKESNETINIRLNQRQGYRVDTDRPNNVQQTVTIEDNEKAGILLKNAQGQPISSLQFSTQENSNTPLTFTAQLTSKPTDKVQLYFFSSNPGEGILTTTRNTTTITDSEIVLNFTPDNWNQPQSFSVVPQNDSVADGQVRYAITNRVRSQDPTYNDTNDYQVSLGITDRLIELGKANNQLSVSNPNSPKTEQKEKAFDNDSATKWLIFSKQAWLQVGFLDSAAVVNSYSLTSANDLPQRDPQNWELLGSNDGQNFEVLDQQSGVKFNNRFETKTFDFDNGKSYNYYRLNILTNSGANEIQLAEFNLHVKDQLVIANNDDNDTPGFTVTPLSSTTEGTGDAFSIKLNSQPVGKVVVTMTPGNEEFYFLSKNPGDTHSITFDPQNWNTPQTIQITAVDDNKVEYLQKSDIKFQVSGEDGKYNSLILKPLEVIIKDNDIPTAKITPGKAAAEIYSTPGYFIIELDRDPNNLPPNNTGIEVNYRIVGGTATLNADYQSINTSKVRVFGNQVLLPIVPIDDKRIEDLTFTINKVTPGTTNNGKTTLTLDVSAKGVVASDNILITASSLSSPNGEQKESAADKNSQTKWLISNNSGWIQYEFVNNPTLVSKYYITSANDFSGRDPVDWTLQGSNDGQNFVPLDTRANIKFANRFEQQAFTVNNPQPYRYYRLNVTKNNGGIELQLADFTLEQKNIIDVPTASIVELAGQKTGSVKTPGRIDQFGQGWFSFDGNNDYVSLPSLTMGGDFTVEAWVRVNQHPQSNTGNVRARIIDFGNGAVNNNIILNFDGTTGRLRLETYNGSNYTEVTSDSQIPTGEWIHVAGVNDGKGNASLYINGELVKSEAGQNIAQNISRSKNFIAQSNWSNEKYFNGDIAELRVWDTVRSHQQIKENINRFLTDKETDLKVYFSANTSNFNQPGTTTQIQGINGINGTLQNGAIWTVTTVNNPIDNNVLNYKGQIQVEVDSSIANQITANSIARFPSETVTVELLPGDGYKLGDSKSSSLNIIDNDVPGIRIVTGGNRAVAIEDDPFKTNDKDEIRYSQYELSLLSEPSAPVTLTLTSNTISNTPNGAKKQLRFIDASDPQKPKPVDSITLTFQPENWYQMQTVNVQAIDDGILENDTDPSKPHEAGIQYQVTSRDPNYNNLPVADQIVGLVDRVLDKTQTNEGIKAGLDTLQSTINNLELPIIGSLEGRSPTLMADLGNLVSKQINQLEPDQLTSTQLDNFLEKALTELGIPGVNVTTKMTDTDVYFAFDLNKEYNLFKLDLSSDLGVPALGIGFETQGQLTGNFKYDIGLGFGINKLLGFYLDPDKTKFSADVSLNLGDFKGKGNLGFLQVDFADDPKNPTKLGVSFNVKLKDPQAGKNNLKKVSPPVTTINVAASPVETTPADQITIPQTQSLPSVPTEKAAIQPLTDSQPVLPKEPSTTVPGKNIKQIPLADKTLTGIVAEKTVQYNQNLSAILATAPLTSTFTNISAQTIRSWLGKPDTDVSVISQQVINALKNAAPAVKVALQTLLKDAGQIDIGLNDKQLQITYLGTIDVTQLKTVVPGVKDLPLDGLKLPVTKPRLTITNPGLENANYTFAADSLPTAELVTWLANKGKTLLPAEVQTVLNELLKLGQNLDVVFASDQIQVTYQGSLDIAQLRGVIPGIKDLPLNGLTLPVEKPSITITDPGSKSANYTFTAASLPKAQLVNWLSNQAKTLLPTQVQEVLNKLLALTQNVDLVLGKEQIQITAKGDLDIATVIREIPGVKELPLNDLSLPVKNPSITITNPQSKNASYIFVAESLPKQQLANWVTQKATTLLPTEVQDVLNKLLALTNTVDLVLGKNQIEVAYKGNLNLATLIKKIPGVKDLPLGGLTLDVTNPRLTITNPTSANPDYAFAVDSLPKRQIINWLGNQGKSLLPQEVQTILNQLLTSELERVDLVLGKKQMQITYKGDLQLDSFIKFIPGLSDLPLDGLNLPVTNPSLTLVNLEQGVNNIDYVFSVDRLPKDELTKWLREKAVSLLPQEVRNVLDNLLQVAENVDLKLGKNQIQVAYLGNLELGAILKQIPGIQDLPLDTLKLPVTNPKLTIINPNSQDIDYSFVADNLPKQELIDWLVQQLPDNVKSILNTVSNAAQQVDVLFSDRQLQLGYKGNIDLAKIVKVIPGIQELPNLDSLALPVANPRLTLSNLGTKNLKNIDYTFSSDSLPKAELVNWVKTTLLQQLPADVQSFLQKALDIVKNIDLKFGNNQIQIGYLGDLNLKTIIDQIGTQLGDFLSPLKGLNLTLTNPSITITNPKQTPSLSFGVDNLPMNQVKTWLTEQVKTYVSDASVQNFLTGLLNEIAQIDLVVGDTQTQITYLGTVDLAKALKTIPGLESFTPNNLTLPILNPSFTVTRTGKTRTFSLSAESLPKQELTEWLGTEIKNQLPAEVRSIVDSLLAVADKMDVQLGSNQVQFNYQGALDLATIIKEIPGLKELPVNNLQLPVLNPRLAITNPGKNASYSFAADELPKTQLVTWIKQQLPTDVQSVLDTITAQAQQLDVVVGNNQIQLTYNGAVDLVKVLGLIPGVKELLPATTQPLNIINPSLTILNPGKNASFSFAADKLPKQELLDLISSQIPTEVKSVFNNLSENLDVIFGQGIIQVNYRGDVDLMKIASLIPGVKELPLNGLKLNVTNPSFTLINKGKAAGATLATFDYVFAADKLPTQDLINWAKNTAADILPAEVKGVLDKLLNIAKDVNFTLGNGQMQIAYNGNLDIAQVIGLIPGLQDVSVFKGLNLPVTNPSITIINPKPGTGLKTQYLLKSDRLPKEELAKWAKEKATALLPADVAKILGSLSAIAQGIDLEIGTNQIQLSFQGTVNLSNVLKEIPGVNQLPLDKLKLPVLNPSLTITNPGKNASYSFAAAQLPKEQLINWLKDQAKALIPSELLSIFNTLANIGQNLDVRFGDSQLQVMYQGNLNLVDILKSIPGLSSFNVSDLTLNVQNPSITILNPGRNADFSFKADKLPVDQLKDWLTKKVVNLLPEVATNIIKDITGVLDDVNVIIDKNDIQILYNGSLDLSNILQKIPGLKNVSLPPANTLLVTNPAITLTKGTDSSIDFNFTAEKLSKDGLKKWLIDTAQNTFPTSVRDLVAALIDTAADFDVLFKNNKLQISYAGTLDAAKVIQKIPGLSELQTTGLALPITNPILTIYDLDKGISKANYTFAADHLPKEELINWLTKQATSQLPQSVLNVVDDLLELARRIDLQLGKNTVQITYQGVLDLADVLRKIPGINNLSFNGLDLPITNPSVTITKPEVTASGTPGTWKDASFSFKADKLPTEQLANWLTNKAGSILPTTISKPVEEILTAFGPVNLSLSNDKFQFSADTIKLEQVINAIPGLNSIFTTIPELTLKNTSLTLSNFGQGTTQYQFASSEVELNTLATALGLPSNISTYLPTVNLFVGSDRLLFSAPQSLDLKTIVPINSLGLPEIITKYIPDIKLDNAQLSITKTGTSGKEINLSGTISGLELGLTYSNGKWTFKGIDDGGRLSALDLIDLLKQGKGKAKQGFFDLVEYQLTGGANLGLTTKTSIEGNPAFPAFSFDLAANFPVFNYGNQQEASKTGANIKLNNIAIDLGSFISNLIGPIIKEVNEIIEPLKPVIQLLNSDTKLFTTLRLSGFDDNRDGKVTLLEIAKKLAPADQKAKIEKSQKFIKAVGDIVELITELSKMPANQPIIIDLGSYTLSGFKAASKDAKDAANKVETNNNGNTSALQTTNSTIDPIKQAEQKSSGKPASGFLSKLKNIEGLQFPVLTNPMKAIDLLLGKTTDLVIYDVPDLDFNFAMSKNFPIWGPIAGQLSGEFSAKTNLLVGFDSYGVNQWKDKRFAFKDIYRIFDGFYVGDWNAQGQDIDELVLNATIAAGLGLDIGFASAFMRGGIQGKVGLDFNDVGENNGTSDGKIRGSEIISRINNPLQLFDLNGNIDAFLDAKVSVAIVGTVWQKEFARFNLAKFSLGASGFSASGALSQSYIAGATIFFDVNFNNQWDEEEIKSITDEYGQFNLDLPVELDKNNNGQIDINEGQLLGLGGFDTSSGLPSGALIALPGATIITPLTSLQAKLVQGGLDRDEANTLVKQQLGLDLAVNLETFDPLKAVGENSANGLKVYLTHVQIQALLNQGRALLDGLQTATPEGQANPNNLLDAIAGLAKFLQQRSAQTQTGLDFTKETDLKPFFSFLITERNLTATEQQLDTVAQIVVQGNEYLSQIAQIATKRTLAEVLPAIASMKRLVQSDSTKLVTELAQGKKTSAEVEQEFETTLKKSNTFVDADIAAFGNRRIRVVTVNKEIAENSTNSVEFTIELNQPAPNQGLTVFYSLTGTATLNQDYKLDVSTDTIGELYIAPGQSTATIKVTAVNDTIDEPLETIAIRLKSVGEGYTIDPTGTVGLIEIQDDDQDVVNNPVTGIVKLGTFADDTLTGATGNDRLEGDYGDDNLDGKEGNDILRGGENNDTLTGGAGDDVLEGNYGDDNLNGGDGNDLLEGSIGEDTLKGGAGIDILKGGVDNDILEGNAGNDQIEGQSGNDILVGNEDNDWLVGGEGHDVLIGGLGDDILNGGQGADVFFLNSANDGFDTLLDFNPSQGDKIQISASGFGVDNLNDFTFLSGILDFQGKNLALIQNNGATYSFFPNLSEIIQIVDAPQAIPEVTPQVKAATEPLKTINTGVTAANSIPESTDTSNKSLLDKVLERGYITFGTSNSYATTLGFDLEFVKAIAVALFGDESKIKLVTTSFDDGFTQVANQTLDLTARRVSQNLDRDTERNVDFGPVYLYDYQAILVKADSNIENASDLKGKGLTIGVVSATNALGNLQNLLTPQGINFTPKEFKTTDELFAAYHNGEIAAISTDRALIYNRLGDAIAQNRILDVEFSQEPISLVLPENESEWADVVRWVTYATIQAEEFGITSENIGQIIAENTDTDTKNDASPAIRRFLGLQDELGKALNIRNDFVVQIIKQVGNYGEIYDRHFSNLERDLNLLWTDDGLMYSPPFSGVTQDIQLINNDQRNLLAEIQQRGVLKFGIPEGSTFPGFAEKNNDGTYQGFDIDLGRAIAVAVFGDASKIEFVSQQFNDGFANTANGKVDVSAAAYTHNLMRDASLGIDYSPIYLYTEQGILTRVDSDITALPLLNGRAVGVVAGTTALQNLEDALKVFDVKINPVIYSSSSEMYAAYDSKQVDAVFNDVSLLAGRISSLPHPEEHRIIRDNFTKEPLALIVDENQSDWADVVRWVTNALKQAEQYGITSKNIDQFIADNTDNLKENNSSIEIQAFLGLRGNIGTSLGLPNDFVVKMIKEVGNYSEIYARNFNTDLLPRQKNELSKELGLQTTAPLGINTNNLNSMPIAEDDNAQTTTNTAVNIDVLNNDKDLDNNPLTLSIVSTPSHGQVQINDNGTPNDKTDDFIIYTANSNFTGIDKFTYQVNDGKGGTDSASVNVSVKSAVVFNNQNNVLKLQGQLNNQKLKFSLNSKHLEKQVIHEVAFVAYDNEQGAVNGLLPGQNGYLNALLQRAEIIFSVIPDNFIADPTKIIDGFQSQYLGAVLLQDTSLDAVKADSSLLNRVLLGSPFNSSSSEILDINELAAGKLQLSFQDQLGDAQKDLVLTVETTNEPVPLGADLQRQSGMEVVDLRDFNGKEIQALFPVVASEAAYDNTIGFYQVEDTQGTVKDGLTGTLFRPGDAGYDQAAIRNSQLYGVIMNNHGAGTQGVFAGGKIYAPYLIANGTVDGALGNTGVPVYFAFLGANPDKKDHVLSLGDNMWAFEDLPNGGDLDFNDIVVQAKFSVI